MSALLGVELGNEHGIESCSRWKRSKRGGGELLPVPRAYALVVGNWSEKRSPVPVVRQDGQKV